MRAVGIKNLKNRLSEYVRLARGGETILVVDRDVVVAELVPPGETRAGSVADAHLADLVRRGLCSPPLLGAAGPPPRAPVALADTVLEELAVDREER